MTRVIFVRHTFRGPSNVTGTTKIIFPPGSRPESLNIPTILTRIYDENAMETGTPERAETVAQSLKNICHIIADLSTQRTFETGKAVAKAFGFDTIRGVPTSVNVPADPVVVAFTIPVPPEDRIREANRIRTVARKVARAFLNNLQLEIAYPSPNPTNPIWELLNLPDLSLLAETVVMAAGFPDTPLIQTLKEAGWPEPLDPEMLAEQAQFLIGVEHELNNPPGVAGNHTAATPAEFILNHLHGDKNIVAISHDSLLIPLLIAIGIPEILILPFQEFHFELIDNRIRVTSIRFAIERAGNVSLDKRIEAVLGDVDIYRFEALAKMALSVPKRARIPI
jgi:hypothetical protein